MKRKMKLLTLATLLAMSWSLSSCTNSSDEFAVDGTEAFDGIDLYSSDGFDSNVMAPIEGMDIFIAKASPIIQDLAVLSENYNTTDQNITAMQDAKINLLVNKLISCSTDFMETNGISVAAEFGDPTDPRIAVVGMALIEYQELSDYRIHATKDCVLSALGVKELLGGKIVIRQLIKAGLKKAVPYIGWGLTIADFADCMMG